MNDITTILLCCSTLLDSNPLLRHLGLISEAMLSMTGRVTMLGISRWTEKGGSYRTIERFFTQKLNWLELNWCLFKHFVLTPKDVILIAGDMTTVLKSGKHTYGLGRYFHSIYNRAVPGLCFVNFSLISVKQRRAFPMLIEQVIKPQTPSQPPPKPKRDKPGRPKGSRNKKHNIQLSPQNKWLQELLTKVVNLIGKTCKASYFLYDNALGNAEGVAMVSALELHLISKLKCNSALWFPYEGEYAGRGAPRIYGDKVNYEALPKKYLKESSTEGDVRTDIYQMNVRHKSFANPLNVVIIRKTHLNRVNQVILFSTDLELKWELLIDYYSLRFQIEFTFREAKQYWGLEDFMNVIKQRVHNGANLALFMVNLVYILRQQTAYQGMSVLDLKAWFRAGKFVRETLKHFDENLDEDFISQIISQSARLGRIHAPQEVT